MFSPSSIVGGLVDCENPWPGLATFTEEQSSLFFGREQEIRDLTRRTEGNALTVLFGQSGLGKSSLLNAGVFPRLRARGYWPVAVRLDHSPGAPTPTEQIKLRMHAESARAGTWTRPGIAKSGESLWEFFHHRDDHLVGANGKLLVPVLVFDQFEELFTLGAGGGSERERAVAFMSELAELVENRPSERLVARLEESSAEMEVFDFSRTDYRVVINLREDYLPHLENLKAIMPALMENRMRLAQMTGAQALEAVVKPGGTLVTEDVARAIVEFVAGARGGSSERLAELQVEPPLLSVICRELNERRRKLGHAQITTDLVTGNRREILTDFYERSVTDLPPEMRTFIEDRLLTKSGFRDNLSLESALEYPGVTRPLIDTLVSRRLLHLEDRLGLQRVELTHDVLAEVIRAARDSRQQRLEIERMREQEQRILAAATRRSGRLRWAIAAMAVISLTAVGGMIGLQAKRKQEARLSSHRASQTDLVFASRLLGEGKVSDGLAYLVRAARRDPTNNLLAPRILTTLVSHNFFQPEGAPLALPSPATQRLMSQNTLETPRFMADAHTLLVQSADRVVRAIDTGSWRIVREFRFESAILDWAISRGSDSVFAAVLADRSIVVCDPYTGLPRFPPARLPGEGTGTGFSVVLSDDGRWIACLQIGEPFASLWDARTGELRETFRSASGYLSFSSDSRLFITRPLAATGVGSNGTVQVWSLPDVAKRGNPIVFSVFAGGRLPILTPDGKSILTEANGKMQLYDIATGSPKGKVFTPAPVGASSLLRDWLITPDSTRVILMGDGEVYVTDLATGTPAFPPLPHGGQVYAPVLSRDGKVLLTICTDGFSRLWSMETGKLLAEPTLQQNRLSPATLSPDGSEIVQFSVAGPAYRMRLARGAQPLKLPQRTATEVTDILNSAPNRVIRRMVDRTIAMDIASGREGPDGFSYPDGPVVRTAMSPDGLTALALMPGNVWHMWRRDGPGASFRDLGALDGVAVGPQILWNSTSEFLATYIVGGLSVRIWNTKTGELQKEILPDTGSISACGWSPDGKFLTGLHGKRIGVFKLEIWSLPTGQSVKVILSERTKSMTAFSLASDRVGFSADDGAIHVCDFPGGTERFVLRLPGGEAIIGWVFSRDGQRIATTDAGGGVQFWNAADGQLIRSSQLHRGPALLQRNPNGSPKSDYYILSASRDGTAQLWDARDGSPVGNPLVHSRAITAARFTPDGTRIVTGTSSDEVRLWDAASGQPLTERLGVDESSGPVVGFSPDGQFLMTGTAGAVPYQIWSVPPDGGAVPVPSWLLQLATIFGGKRLTDEGEFVSAADEIAQLDGIRRNLAALPNEAPYVEWSRWLLADRTTRSIAPRFTITPAEAAKLAAELGDPNPFLAFEAQDNLLVRQGSLEEAEALERRTLEAVRAREGQETANVSSWLYRRASTLVLLEKYSEAEPLARASLAMRLKLTATDRYGIGAARSTLGMSLLWQEQYPQAELQLLSAFDDIQRLVADSGIDAERSARLRRIAESLAQLYDATDQVETADSWRARAEALPASND